MPYNLVGIDLEDETGFYQAVGPDGAIELDNQASGNLASPVVLVGDWIYITGDNPRGASASVVAGAEGSSLVIQRIAAAGSQPSRTRIIMLSGTSGWATLKSNGTTTATLSAGQYVDCWEASSTYFGSVSAFDPENTPGSEGLIDQVDEARKSWRIA